MREIKFRYWYGERMLEVGSIEFFTNGEIHVNDELIGGILMQYTGLNDKNGRDIYEGDIVIKNPGTRFEVKFMGGRFFPLVTTTVNGPISDYKAERYEVIGNIYENPELLK